MPLSKVAKQLLLLHHGSDDELSSSDEETAEVSQLETKEADVKLLQGEQSERIVETLDPLTESLAALAPETFQSKRHSILSKVDWHVQNQFYLQCVKERKIDKVKDLFVKAKKRIQNFDKNAQDSSERSALTLAITNKDHPMTCLLLENKVDVADCLFYAIDGNFYDGMVLLLPEEFSDRQTVSQYAGKSAWFQTGLTPILFACQKNNYRILRYLYEKNTDSVSGGESAQENRSLPYILLDEYTNAELDGKLENSNKRQLGLRAAASPAHITILLENKEVDEDVFEYCLQLMRNIRRAGKLDPNFSWCNSEILVDQIERYMCSLLDQISSSQELSLVFEYDLNGDTHDVLNDGTTRCPLSLLEKCSTELLNNFVSHQKSQLALNYLRYKSMEFWMNESTAFTTLYLIGVGLLFPFLSILYTFFPLHFAGKFFVRPLVLFACHKVSEAVFTFLLFLYTIAKTGREDYLGCPPTALECVILLWVIGKWVQEIEELSRRGVRDYFRDLWNYPDLALLSLFSSCIILRIVDFVMNDSSKRITRIHWQSNAPRLWAEDLLSWAYVMVFLRLLEILRESRTLGPLQLSMVRMMNDVWRFLGIFSYIVLAFAFGLTDLYWYYGTDEGAKSFCFNATSINQTIASCVPVKKTSFSNLGNSIKTLFWSLVGHFELKVLTLPSYHSNTEAMGRLLIAIYHVVAIIVVLNMLIAMMSKSYDVTSENEERDWLFNRTGLWIRYIRRDVVRPSPMNLIPNPYWLFPLKEKLCCCFRKKLGKSESLPLSKDFAGESPDLNTETSFQRCEVLNDLIQRYKFKHLLNDS